MESRGFGNPRATFDTYTKGTRGLDDFRWLVLWPLDMSPKPLLYLNPLPPSHTHSLCLLPCCCPKWGRVGGSEKKHTRPPGLEGSCYWRGCQFMAWLDIFACVYIWFCRLNRKKNEAVSYEILALKSFHLETVVFFFLTNDSIHPLEKRNVAPPLFFGTFPTKVMQTFIQQPNGFTSQLSNNHNYWGFFCWPALRLTRNEALGNLSPCP